MSIRRKNNGARRRVNMAIGFTLERSIARPTLCFVWAYDAVRERRKHHQRDIGILLLDGAGNVEGIAIVRTRHDNHQVERGILQFPPSILLGRNLGKTRGVSKTEVHVFIEYLLVDTAIQI